MNTVTPSRSHDAHGSGGPRALIRRATAWCGLLAALAVATVGTAATATAAPTSAAGDEPLVVTIVDQAPAVAQTSDTLRLTLEVTNDTGAEITDPSVTIGVQQEVPRTRATLLNWFNAEVPPRARIEWRSTVTATLPAGETTRVTLDVPMSELSFPIRYDNWGARGLEVTIASGSASAGARTMGVFYPEDLDTGTLHLAALVPAVADAGELTELLPNVLDATAEREPTAQELAPPAAVARAVALLGTGAQVALDPIIAGALPEEVRVTPIGTVLALPWADADLAVLPIAGEAGRTLLAGAMERSVESFVAAPVAATTQIAWPASPITSAALASLTTTHPGGAVLHGISTAPDDDDDTSVGLSLATAASSARVDVETSTGTLPALVGDQALTDLVLGEGERVGLTGDVVDRVDAGVLARQLSLAYTAVVAREGTDPVDLLVLVTRTDAADLDERDVEGLTERLRAVTEAPWITFTDVPTMLATRTDATSTAEELLETGILDETDPVTQQHHVVLTRVQELEEEADALASAFPDGSGLTGLAEVLDLTGSTAWRMEGRSGAVVTDAVAAELAVLSDAVTVTVPSGVNLAANDGIIPVTLTNGLSVPVTAHIEVLPEQLLLRVEELEDVVLEPGVAQSVRIPVEAIANGSTRLDVTVRSPGGAILGSTAAFDIQVRAEWEGAVVGVAAVALSVLLVIGLVRAVRRGRRGTDGVPPGVPDPAHPEPDGPGVVARGESTG